jgi:hypothetical protein
VVGVFRSGVLERENERCLNVARVVLSAWLVRQPVPGILSWGIHWLVALERLGHDVWYFEESGYPRACFDPELGTMGDDCSVGMARLRSGMDRVGLHGRVCYVDQAGVFHGLARSKAEEVLRSSDLLIDLAPLVDFGIAPSVTDLCRRRVMVDGEAGLTQIRSCQAAARGVALREYDAYFTHGMNLGSAGCSIPTLGKHWTPILSPIVPELLDGCGGPTRAEFTTVMNWQSHKPIEWEGRRYGQKDVEFEKFITLPSLTTVPLEVAVSGKHTPFDRLRECGWRVRNAYDIGKSAADYWSYIAGSSGEFSVVKHIFQATWSGFFPDRTAVYLACGRPAVVQDTGFSEHVPCGRGLLAVRDPEGAAAALDAIMADYDGHRATARELAAEYFSPRRTVGRLMDVAGA